MRPRRNIELDAAPNEVLAIILANVLSDNPGIYHTLVQVSRRWRDLTESNAVQRELPQTVQEFFLNNKIQFLKTEIQRIYRYNPQTILYLDQLKACIQSLTFQAQLNFMFDAIAYLIYEKNLESIVQKFSSPRFNNALEKLVQIKNDLGPFLSGPLSFPHQGGRIGVAQLVAMGRIRERSGRELVNLAANRKQALELYVLLLAIELYQDQYGQRNMQAAFLGNLLITNYRENVKFYSPDTNLTLNTVRLFLALFSVASIYNFLIDVENPGWPFILMLGCLTAFALTYRNAYQASINLNKLYRTIKEVITDISHFLSTDDSRQSQLLTDFVNKMADRHVKNKTDIFHKPDLMIKHGITKVSGLFAKSRTRQQQPVETNEQHGAAAAAALHPHQL